ncbi:MAG: S26 family signal peptidase [Prevotella sp.]|jgi:signal peptidase I|nr:S26 family signal peptidase [Prevotella sp.]
MRSTAKFLIALVVAFVMMIGFRALAMTIYTVDDDAFAPRLQRGDRLLVNRWSYGLRVNGGSLFSYGRICRQKICRGDLVAVDWSTDPTAVASPAIYRCGGVPGDTIVIGGELSVVPGLSQCADADYYLMEDVGQRDALPCQGLVKEEQIIGRVTHVVYSHDPAQPLWAGWRNDRTCLPL